MNSPKYLGNYITRYSITKEDIIGKSPDNKKEYDKIMLVFVYLNSQSTNFCEFAVLNTPEHLLCNQMGHASSAVTHRYYLAISDRGIEELLNNLDKM